MKIVKYSFDTVDRFDEVCLPYASVIDFDDGPTSEPDPPHSHPHEQVSYVSEGEIIFFSMRNRPGLALKIFSQFRLISPFGAITK